MTTISMRAFFPDGKSGKPACTFLRRGSSAGGGGGTAEFGRSRFRRSRRCGPRLERECQWCTNCHQDGYWIIFLSLTRSTIKFTSITSLVAVKMSPLLLFTLILCPPLDPQLNLLLLTLPLSPRMMMEEIVKCSYKNIFLDLNCLISLNLI